VSERIVIEIDDSQLDQALAKLNVISITGQRVTGSRNLSTSLPTINRELRLILGRIPGMRAAMGLIFRLRRIERGVAKGGMELGLTTVASLVLIVQFLWQAYQRIEKRQRAFESLARRERGISKSEYKSLRTEWQAYLRDLPG